MPIFFRVRGPDGRPVPWVELEAHFSPGNQYVRGKRHADASGTCLLHWPREADSVAVRISHGVSVAAVNVPVERANPHRVVEVSLATP
ncbi:MAG: hypothetical protein JNM74_06395 [Myxococcales bacterium]|nr:hypothetical protein [Myxococcales bacterium]